MEKVMVIGCPGSGKSTFSKELHDVTGIPLYHLDMLNWNADRTTVSEQIFRERLSQVIEKEKWIVDGNYDATIESRLQVCDTVFFLDYSVDICLDGVMSRRGIERTDMPWVESLDEIDEEFIQFIQKYDSESKPIVMKLLNQYSDKKIFIFHSRNDSNEYLAQLKRELPIY